MRSFVTLVGVAALAVAAVPPVQINHQPAAQLEFIAASIQELTVDEWTQSQSAWRKALNALKSWEWIFGAAVEEHPQEEEERTIYDILSQDEKFSKIVKLIDYDDEFKAVLNDTSAGVTFFAPDNDAFPRRPHNNTTVSPASLPGLLPQLLEAHELSDDPDDDKKEKWRQILKKLLHNALLYHTLPRGYASTELINDTTFATSLKATDGSYGGQYRRIKVDHGFFGHGIYVNVYASVKRPDIRAKNGVIHVLNAPLFPTPSILDQLFLFPNVLSTLTSSLQKVGLEQALQWHWEKGENGEDGGFTGDGPAVTVFAPTNDAFNKLPFRLRLFLFSPFGEHVLLKLLQYHIVPNYIFHTNWQYNATTSEENALWSRGCGGGSEIDDKVFAYSELFDIPTPPDHLPGGGPMPHPPTPPTRLPNFPTRRPVPAPPHRPHPPPPSPPPPPPPPVPPRRPGPPHYPPHNPHHGEPASKFNLTLPTLLGGNSTVSVLVETYKANIPHVPTSTWTKLFVNGVPVVYRDGPARNGAIHAIPRVLSPRVRHGCHGRQPPLRDAPEEEYEAEWEGWEEWLPAWAAAQN